MSDFIEQMHGQSLQIDIKTLPMMHLGKISTLNTPCLLFAQTGPIEQSVRKKHTALKSFYSGDYLILGFKHIITSNDASSKFNLIASSPKIEVDDEEKNMSLTGDEWEVVVSGEDKEKQQEFKGGDG